MQRLARACVASLGVVAMLASPSIAQTESSPGMSGGVKDKDKGEVEAVLEENLNEPGVSPVSSAVDHGKVWVTWLVIRNQTTEPCIGREGELMDPEENLDFRMSDQLEQFERMLTHAILNGHDVAYCDEPPLEDPLEVVRRVVEERLPDVDIEVQPPGGRALVGWHVYLTLGRDPVFEPPPTTVSLLSRDVEVTMRATATTEVDWDDDQRGDSVQSYPETRGVAWEHRDDPDAVPIRHLYQDVGQRWITVTDTWQVEVDAAGIGQWSLTIPRDPVQVPLQVTQSQSVVTAQQ